MNRIAWEKELETGNEHVDFQHRLFFEKINYCIDASRNNSSREHLVALLQDILKCLIEHFRDEEKLMLEKGLSPSSHLSQHFNISQRLSKQILAFKWSDEKEKLSAQYILFSLYEWYLNHMQTEDQCFHNLLKDTPDQLG